jgi:aspartate kinase
MEAEWIDARKVIKTNNDYREAKVNWAQTEKNIKKHISPSLNKDKLVITQGFIGSTAETMTSTLGREGSDFTAAIIGSVLDAEYVAVWKDVPGILNADPKLFNFAKKMALVSYKEAIEMTYYGAKVLHPKTIKPLENKGIPLHVMSFVKPTDDGTIIRKLDDEPLYPPITIKEPNQIVISIYTTDFSFISESDMSRILLLCSEHKVRVNMMQNKAISMNLCCTNKDYKIEPLINDLEKEFTVINKDKLELLTIRHYNYEIVYELSKSKNIIMEQKSASTYQFVIEP